MEITCEIRFVHVPQKVHDCATSFKFTRSGNLQRCARLSFILLKKLLRTPTTKCGLLPSLGFSKPHDVVCSLHMDLTNHKMWFVAVTWIWQTTKCGLQLSLGFDKPHHVVCSLHLDLANHTMRFVAFAWNRHCS